MTFVTSILDASIDYALKIIQGVISSFIVMVLGLFDDEFFVPGTSVLEKLLGGASSDLFQKMLLTVKIIAFSLALLSFVLSQIKRSSAGLYDSDNTIVEDVIRVVIALIFILGSTSLLNHTFSTLNILWEMAQSKWKGAAQIKGNAKEALDIFSSPDEDLSILDGLENLLDGETFATVSVYVEPLIVIILDLFMLFSFVKMLISTVSRLATLDCIVLLSPLSCSFLTSRKGALVFSQTAKIIAINSAVIVITKAWVYSAASMITNIEKISEGIFLLCYLKVGCDMERLLKELNLTSAVMLGDVGKDMLGTLRDLTLVSRGSGVAKKAVGSVVATKGAMQGNIGLMSFGDSLMNQGGVSTADYVKGARMANNLAVEELCKRNPGNVPLNKETQNLANNALREGDAKSLNRLAGAMDENSAKRMIGEAVRSTLGNSLSDATGKSVEDLNLKDLKMSNGAISGTMVNAAGERVGFSINNNPNGGFMINNPDSTWNGSYMHVGQSMGTTMKVGEVSKDKSNFALKSAGFTFSGLSETEKDHLYDNLNSKNAVIDTSMDGRYSVIKGSNGEEVALKDNLSKAEYFKGQKEIGSFDFNYGALKEAGIEVINDPEISHEKGTIKVEGYRNGKKIEATFKNAAVNPPKSGTKVMGSYMCGNWYEEKSKEIADN